MSSQSLKIHASYNLSDRETAAAEIVQTSASLIEGYMLQMVGVVIVVGLDETEPKAVDKVRC